ncbi:hypothetical protein EVAR_41527_1 [Eumeta japonica]|uniref:Uncharacterized protein n=1 Tax=Eumeta variegata TaxID=151549 RepID=A0A4C1X6H1_EUMVA|nr:hypothetical protein EVAR_41527_1 [Eumeta japonica]
MVSIHFVSTLAGTTSSRTAQVQPPPLDEPHAHSAGKFSGQSLRDPARAAALAGPAGARGQFGGVLL